MPCENPALLVDRYYPDISPDRSEIENSLGIRVAAVVPSATETRLRVSNLGKTVYEVAPKDFLAQKLRQLVLELANSSDGKGQSVKDRILGMLGRREA